MIRYFNRNETSFNHNERILTPLSCYIIEEANEMYELESEFARNVNITEGDIIKAPSPRGDDQLFRIYRVKKSLKGKTAYAKHIFYDLTKNFLVNVELNNKTGFTALQSVLSNCETSHSFIAMSDVQGSNTATYKRINPVQAIIGDENSVLNLWGGNLVRDNFNIQIKANGIDRGYEIRMGKNLIGIDADIDESNVKTRIYPTVELDDSTITLPEKYVDSTLINNYGDPIIYTEEIKLTDEQKVLPVNDIYNIMRDYCNRLFETHNVDKPLINYKVDFVELSKTEQYKDLAILEQLDLYDIVTVNVSHLDINMKARCIKYKYDCLKERYVSIELGDFSSISNYKTDSIVKQLQSGIKASQSAAEYATNVITGNKGGYVVIRRYPDGKPYEILIMDTEDINTAQNVFRLNNSGLGFSRTGYNGTYDTAMTIDGHIVADYIDTGVLTTILLKSMDDSISINLSNGTFALKDSHGEALITSDGVANSDNISFVDNVQDGYPLRMPFNIDENVSKINKVLLKFTIDKFRTYSNGASSGGGSYESSSTDSTFVTTNTHTGNYLTNNTGWMSTSTGAKAALSGESHTHTYYTPDHAHYFQIDHTHGIYDPGHSHSVSIPSHTHNLNFGIMETDVIHNLITIRIDGVDKTSVNAAQGIVDLTEYITTVGWHTIELYSATKKRISAQIVIKSYIRS